MTAQHKRTWTKGLLALSFLLLAFLLFGLRTHAEELSDDPQSGTSMTNHAVYESDSVLSNQKWSAGRGLSYTRRNGIDISSHNGTVDWAAVKASGVEHAIIRVGYRGYETGVLAEDANYATNIQGALDAGLKVGVYLFSQATTTTEAVEEANYIVARISSYEISLPVVMDFEYASGNTGRLYNAGLSASEATSVVDAFCDTVESYGYEGMVYANKNMLTNSLNAATIASEHYVWLANYMTPQLTTYGEPTTTYAGDYEFWQFSSQGNVDGVSGYVDLDYWYDTGVITGSTTYAAVFDPTYYAAHNADVYAAYGNDGAALLKHFLNYGMNEGRQGISTFNVTSYAYEYPDLRAAFGTDRKSYYFHYINYGKNEGRNGTGCSYIQGGTTVYHGVDYSAVYDATYYTTKYSDIKNAFTIDDTAILAHFVNNGIAEGRQAIATFSVTSYKYAYQDLRVAFYGQSNMAYVQHYMAYGKNEGRMATGISSLQNPVTSFGGVDYSKVYNYSEYQSANSDIKAAFGNDDIATLLHFIHNGMSEGRTAKSTFVVSGYKNRYSDLRAAFGTDYKSYYLHYINYGATEGRDASATSTLYGAVTIYNGVDYSAVYDYNTYVNTYADIKAAFGTDDTATLQHFVTFGMSEGRTASTNFNVSTYRNRYADLQAAFGDDLKSYYLHYVTYGKNEGRSAI